MKLFRSVSSAAIRAAAACLTLSAFAGIQEAGAVDTHYTSSWPVGLTAFNGKLWLAWHNAGSIGPTQDIWIASSPDGVTWTVQKTIYGTGKWLHAIDYGINLAVFNNTLYMAYSDVHDIVYNSSTDGTTWATPTPFLTTGAFNQTSGNVAIASTSGTQLAPQLMIAWNGVDAARTLNVGCIACNGVAFGSKYVASGIPSYSAPSMTTIGGNFIDRKSVV